MTEENGNCLRRDSSNEGSVQPNDDDDDSKHFTEFVKPQHLTTPDADTLNSGGLHFRIDTTAQRKGDLHRAKTDCDSNTGATFSSDVVLVLKYIYYSSTIFTVLVLILYTRIAKYCRTPSHVARNLTLDVIQLDVQYSCGQNITI